MLPLLFAFADKCPLGLLDVLVQCLRFALHLRESVLHTTSPIDTMPTSRSFSTTGTWRDLPAGICSIIESTGSDKVQGDFVHVRTRASGSVSTLAPRLASARTISRSDRRPITR